MSDSHEKMNSSAEKDEAAAAPAHAARSRRGIVRAVLLSVGPVLVLLGGTFVYVNTGRFVETDNAYVKATTAVIGTEVAGLIAKVPVVENQSVHKGDVLFEIQDDEYRVAVERAKSQMDAVRSFITGLQASYQRGLEELSLAHTNVAFAERELAREQSLAERQLGSEADLDTARHELDIARQQIPIIEQSLAQLRAQLGGATGLKVEDHAAYRTVKSMLEDAVLNLSHTVVRAPFDGIATRVPAPGGFVARGGPVMGLVAATDVWVEANFKETQLTHVDVGQAATIHIDTYPEREWHGHVKSISPATGSEFSVIPAQNASGNWVKVAQRIPVRIEVEMSPQDPPLRAGMSAVVEIDSGIDRRLPGYLSFLHFLKI
jgi:membrane fusion protein (multidrug efflux system)